MIQWILLMNGMGVYGLSLVVLFEQLLRLIVGLWIVVMTYNAISDDSTVNWKVALKNCFRFGVWHLLGEASFNAIFKLDNIIAIHFVSVNDIVYYYLRQNIFSTIISFSGRAFSSYIPAISKGHSSGDIDLIRRIFLNANRISSSLIAVVSVFYVVFIHRFLEIWTHKIIPENPELDLLFGLLIFIEQYILDMAVVNGGLGYRTARYGTIVISLEAIANVTLSWVLGAKWGMIGIVLGTLIPRVLITAFFFTVHITRELQISSKRILYSLFIPSLLVLILAGILILLSKPLSDVSSRTFMVYVSLMSICSLGMFLYLSLSVDQKKSIVQRLKAGVGLR